MQDINKVEKIIGYQFQNKKLLEMALTHTSYANEHGTESFERLEFLGDSVLGFATAQHLFRMFPDKKEGELSKIRAGLVCEEALSGYSKRMGLPQYILLGVGEEKGNGREKNSILSDSFEALIAAIYLDGGFHAAINWIDGIIQPDCYLNFVYKDWKTLLQEKYKNAVIEYKTFEQSDHSAEKFHAEVYINEKKRGSGSGTTKKAAEQMAAQQALK